MEKQCASFKDEIQDMTEAEFEGDGVSQPRSLIAAWRDDLVRNLRRLNPSADESMRSYAI